ncbi:hypothetical protein CCH79_00020152 [Gambusia affinis]|uniref:Uncharacterized protein n=1 Tax=Gambusia affinis TaxID=33528 RepID=A0A315VFE1_GAMAF|nr:hypothetical protein CCH79_00020152 [Gambusia affinis]
MQRHSQQDAAIVCDNGRPTAAWYEKPGPTAPNNWKAHQGSSVRYSFFFYCYRSVPLKNGYNEKLDLAALLVYINVQQAGRAEEELYSSSSQLRKKQVEHSEPFLYDTHSNLQRAAVPAQHGQLVRESSERHRYLVSMCSSAALALRSPLLHPIVTQCGVI